VETAGQRGSLTQRYRLPPGNAPRHRVGCRVYVTRTRHGWHDGALVATVIAETRVADHYEYMVRDDNGQEYEVKHQRDMTPG